MRAKKRRRPQNSFLGQAGAQNAILVGAAASATGALLRGIMPRLFTDKTIVIEIESRDARDRVSLKLPGVRIKVGPQEEAEEADEESNNTTDQTAKRKAKASSS
jgi:hypothetical protein